jgi:ATP-dependent DNA helicase RecQ
MDEEHLEEIFEYFKNQAQTDNISDALRDLGEDEYSEIEIRLVRVKFLSEMGN